MSDFRDFAWHCHYAYLNDTVKDYLQSLKAPYPESIKTKVGKDDVESFLLSMVGTWHIFRTLSRVSPIAVQFYLSPQLIL
jgi:hypothetical protein